MSSNSKTISKAVLTPVSEDEKFFDSFIEGNICRETYFNTNEYFSNQKNCVYCVTKGKPDNEKRIKGCTAHNGENKGNIHYEAEKCIKNPKYLLDISGIDFIEELKKNGMDPGKKKIIFNTCIINFTKNCTNCMERRCRKMDIDKYSFKFCWSKTKEGLNTICIGFHSNFEFKISNNKIVKESIKISVFDGYYERNKKSIAIPVVEPLEENFNDNKKDEFPELGNGKISPTNRLWLDVKNSKVGSVEDEGSVKSSRISDVTDNDFSPSFNNKLKISNDFNDKTESVAVLETTSPIIKEKTDDKEVSSTKMNELEEENKLLKKENQTLKNENKVQKDGLIALKTLMINDTDTSKQSIKIQELEQEIKQLKENNDALIIENNNLDRYIKNLRMIQEQSENSIKLSPSDKKEIEKDINTFSSVITNSVLSYKGYE